MDILALTKELDDTKAELATANESIASANATVEAATAELTKATDALATLQASADAAAVVASEALAASHAEVAKLTAEAKTVDQRVLEITGKSGGKPAENITSGTARSEMSRAEFGAIPSTEQHAFCKAGGKITE